MALLRNVRIADLELQAPRAAPARTVEPQRLSGMYIQNCTEFPVVNDRPTSANPARHAVAMPVEVIDSDSGKPSSTASSSRWNT
jgi:hypothetical protein